MLYTIVIAMRKNDVTWWCIEGCNQREYGPRSTRRRCDICGAEMSYDGDPSPPKNKREQAAEAVAHRAAVTQAWLEMKHTHPSLEPLDPEKHPNEWKCILEGVSAGKLKLVFSRVGVEFNCGSVSSLRDMERDYVVAVVSLASAEMAAEFNDSVIGKKIVPRVPCEAQVARARAARGAREQK